MPFVIPEETEAPSASARTGFAIPPEPATPEYESFGRTLVEAAKKTAADLSSAITAPGRKVADLIYPKAPPADQVGETPAAPQPIRDVTEELPEPDAKPAPAKPRPIREQVAQAINTEAEQLGVDRASLENSRARLDELGGQLQDWQRRYPKGLPPTEWERAQPVLEEYQTLAAKHEADVASYNERAAGLTTRAQTLKAEGEPVLRAAPEPGIFERIAEGLGIRKGKTGSAKATLEVTAREQGETAREFKEKGAGLKPLSEVPGQAMLGVADAASFGVVPLVRRALGYEEEEPETLAGGLAEAAGSVLGFVTGGPMAVAKAVQKAFSGYLALKATDSVGIGIAKHIASVAAGLGAASAAREAGHAVDAATDPLESASILMKAAGRGVLVGAVYGAVGAAIPGRTVEKVSERFGMHGELLERSVELEQQSTAWEKAARVAVGLVLQDAVTGDRPWDDRHLAQKALDYALGAYFLFGQGHNVRQRLDALKAEAKAKGLQLDDTFKLAILEARQKVSDEEFKRIASVFQRRGQSPEQANRSAAQAILQREAGRAAAEATQEAPPAEGGIEIRPEEAPGPKRAPEASISRPEGGGLEIPPERPPQVAE
ncbi:MAG: hypothetical protein ACREIB_01555, partial [Pseudomonadota bacterium]